MTNAVSQVSDDIKSTIEKFLNEEYIELLQKVNDYRSVGSTSLQNSISHELNNLSIKINQNAIIEYAKTVTPTSTEQIISDKIIPFLINYAGKEYSTAKVNNECIVSTDGDYHAYFYSQGIVADSDVLRRAIFRINDSHLELRRISFVTRLSSECQPVALGATSPSTTIAAHRNSLKKKQKKPAVIIPKITLRQVEAQNGYAAIYGFIQNHKSIGKLTDQKTGEQIPVSDLDGYFYINRLMGSNSYLNLHFRYDYGSKFIIDKKLVYLP